MTAHSCGVGIIGKMKCHVNAPQVGTTALNVGQNFRTLVADFIHFTCRNAAEEHKCFIGGKILVYRNLEENVIIRKLANQHAMLLEIVLYPTPSLGRLCSCQVI